MIDLIIFVVLLWTWYAFWSFAEKKHFKQIIQKESELKNIVVLSKYDAKTLDIFWTELVTWNIVLSIDFFKKFLSGFVNFFGWRMSSYESLLDRARRDSIVKIKEKAKKKWFNAIANLRLETSSISKWKKRQIWSIEVLAYATAINLKNAW